MRAATTSWLIVVAVFAAGTAHAEDAAPQKPFDASGAIALLGKTITVTLDEGGVATGVLLEAGPKRILLGTAGGFQVPIETEHIVSIRLDGAPSEPTSAAPAPPPKPAGPSIEYTDGLLNHFVAVRSADRFARGQLVVSTPDGLVVRTAHGTESFTRAEVIAISPDADDDGSNAPRRDGEKWERDKKAANAAVFNREADAHAAAAWSWYLGGVGGCVTAGALFAGWLFILASPACLIGAGVGVVAAAASVIVGLTETAAEQKARTEAHAMAY